MKRIKFDWEKWIGPLIFSILVIISYQSIRHFPYIWSVICNFFSVISPFIAGFVIAYFLNVPCNNLDRLISKSKWGFFAKRSRGLSVLILYMVLIVLLVLTFNFLLPLVTGNIADIVRMIPVYYDNLLDFINDLDTDNLLSYLDLESVIRSFSIQDLISKLGASFGSIGGYAVAITSKIVNIFLSTIASIYMLLYKENLLAYTNRLAKTFIKENSLKTIKEYVNKTNVIFYTFIATQFLDACILGLLAIIILSILGVKYSITLGVILGVFNMIPYFGSIVASVLTVIITIFTGGWNLALITAVSLIVLQQIDGNIIGPRLMGNSLNLNPILIIFSITVGGFYLGIIGMFLSVPIAAILKIIVNNLVESREKKQRASFKGT